LQILHIALRGRKSIVGVSDNTFLSPPLVRTSPKLTMISSRRAWDEAFCPKVSVSYVYLSGVGALVEGDRGLIAITLDLLPEIGEKAVCHRVVHMCEGGAVSASLRP
jgi:hypothetical protein